jgi:hypothetical protein
MWLDLTRQGGFIVTVYDQHDLRLAETKACRNPEEAFAHQRPELAKPKSS